MIYSDTVITVKHKEWGIIDTGTDLKELARSMGAEPEELEIIASVTATEHLLSKVPEEFRGALSYLAYESGHSYGDEEVFLNLRELVDSLVKPIEAFKQRITCMKPE